jgi:hypothetical protein
MPDLNRWFVPTERGYTSPIGDDPEDKSLLEKVKAKVTGKS